MREFVYMCPSHAECGVFILAVDDDPAKACGQLLAGDEVISVNGRSLINHTHHECLQALRAVRGEGTLTIRRRKPQQVNLPPAEGRVHIFILNNMMYCTYIIYIVYV